MASEQRGWWTRAVQEVRGYDEAGTLWQMERRGEERRGERDPQRRSPAAKTFPSQG